MTDILYPTAAELRQIEQDLLPNLMQQRAIFDIFPIREVDDSVIMWEQLDNYVGLQALRGLDGAAPRVKRTGGKRFVVEPGVFGEYGLIDETELTRRRRYGTFDQTVDATDLVASEQMRLIQREFDRIEQIGWTLLSTGTFSVPTYMGAVAFTDSYTTQSFTATPGWATHSTATPLSDFRQVKLKARGHSVRFDATAKAYTNSTTAIDLFSNTNPADIYGRRTAGLGTFNSPEQINGLLAGDGLPQIVEYDHGYLDDNGDFQLFIPDGVVIVIGTRPNDVPAGNYVLTRNANNPGMAPGSYTKVVDNGEDGVPRSIAVHRGHNGAPTIDWPSSVVVMAV